MCVPSLTYSAASTSRSACNVEKWRLGKSHEEWSQEWLMKMRDDDVMDDQRALLGNYKRMLVTARKWNAEETLPSAGNCIDIEMRSCAKELVEYGGFSDLKKIHFSCFKHIPTTHVSEQEITYVAHIQVHMAFYWSDSSAHRNLPMLVTAAFLDSICLLEWWLGLYHIFLLTNMNTSIYTIQMNTQFYETHNWYTLLHICIK